VVRVSRIAVRGANGVPLITLAALEQHSIFEARRVIHDAIIAFAVDSAGH
jgi:hypothetical protein